MGQRMAHGTVDMVGDYNLVAGCERTGRHRRHQPVGRILDHDRPRGVGARERGNLVGHVADKRRQVTHKETRALPLHPVSPTLLQLNQLA